MRHEKIKKLVSAYIDGELKNNLEFIRKHIETCEECTQLVKVSKMVRETVKDKTIEVSPYLLTRLKAEYRERKVQPGVWDYVVSFARELAIVLILIFVLLIGIEIMSRETILRIDEVILSETPSVQKVISSEGNLSKEDVLELTLSNGGKK
jgi:predicted anti-sigma-YlaC factor YlaD